MAYLVNQSTWTPLQTVWNHVFVLHIRIQDFFLYLIHSKSVNLWEKSGFFEELYLTAALGIGWKNKGGFSALKTLSQIQVTKFTRGSLIFISLISLIYLLWVYVLSKDTGLALDIWSPQRLFSSFLLNFFLLYQKLRWLANEKLFLADFEYAKSRFPVFWCVSVSLPETTSLRKKCLCLELFRSVFSSNAGNYGPE